MIRLFLLYAILIFAKKAPKLIADLLKLDNKDGVGLKGLNIKNKMGEAALVGDKVKKGMMGLEGGAKKALGAGKQLVKDGLKKSFDPLKGKLKTAGYKMFDNLKNGDIKGAMKEGHDSIWGKDARKNNAAKLGKGLKQNFIDEAGANAKKVKAVGKQGFKEYKDQENTKGAHFAGRLEIDPSVQTLTNKINNAISDSVAKSNEKAGFTSIASSNRKDFEALENRLVAMYGRKKANDLISSLGNIDYGDGNQYANIRKTLKGWTEQINGSLGSGVTTSDSDRLFIKQNVLSERDKLYNNLNDFTQRIHEAAQAGDSDLKEALEKERAKCLVKAANTGALGTFSEFGIDKVNVNISKLEGTYNDSNIDSYNKEVNNILATLGIESNKNSKALNAVTKEIEEKGKPAQPVKDDN